MKIDPTEVRTDYVIEYTRSQKQKCTSITYVEAKKQADEYVRKYGQNKSLVVRIYQGDQEVCAFGPGVPDEST